MQIKKVEFKSMEWYVDDNGDKRGSTKMFGLSPQGVIGTPLTNDEVVDAVYAFHSFEKKKIRLNDPRLKPDGDDGHDYAPCRISGTISFAVGDEDGHTHNLIMALEYGVTGMNVSVRNDKSDDSVHPANLTNISERHKIMESISKSFDIKDTLFEIKCYSTTTKQGHNMTAATWSISPEVAFSVLRRGKTPIMRLFKTTWLAMVKGIASLDK